MKKFLLIILILMTICLSIGCVKIGTDTAKDSKKIKIGVCIANANDKYGSYLLDEMKNYSKSLEDVEVLFVDAKQNSNTQLSQVENFISQRVDVIIVTPVYIDSSKPITDKAKAANIPVISLMNPFENQSDAVCYIAPDSKQAAELEMEYLAKKMNYKGNVAIIMGPMDDRAQKVRTETYREIIEKYPDMGIVAEQSAEWNRAKATSLMENWIESGKEIDGVAVNNDEMAIGALNAIEEAGKLGKITVGGIDATPDSLQYLKSGKLAVTVFQDPVKLSRSSIDTAIKAARGENVEKTISIKNELVTPENVDQYIAKWKNK